MYKLITNERGADMARMIAYTLAAVACAALAAAARRDARKSA